MSKSKNQKRKFWLRGVIIFSSSKRRLNAISRREEAAKVRQGCPKMAFRRQHEDDDVAKPSLNTRSQSRDPRVTERMCCKKHGSASPMCSEHQFLHGTPPVPFLKTNVFRTCPGERERFREREREVWFQKRRQSGDLLRREDEVMICEEETITRTLRKGFREKTRRST